MSSYDQTFVMQTEEPVSLVLPHSFEPKIVLSDGHTSIRWVLL